MKLWLLRPVRGLPEVEDPAINPWEPWYDKSFGHVVRAESEHEARQLVVAKHFDEDGFPERIVGDEGPGAWLESSLSTCVELTADGLPGVIITDHHAA